MPRFTPTTPLPVALAAIDAALDSHGTRLTAAETLIATRDATIAELQGQLAAAPRLTVTRANYLTSIAEGALIGTLSAPFGAGTTYAIVGAAPGQLALASGGRIVAGIASPAADTDYAIKIRASSPGGGREIAETFVFRATLDTTAPPPTPSLTNTASGSELAASQVNGFADAIQSERTLINNTIQLLEA